MIKRGDVPFIGGHEDFYYQTKDGKVIELKDDKFYTSFDHWYNSREGFSILSERLISEVNPDNKDTLIQWLQAAFEAGRKLGKEEGVVETILNPYIE